jgi:hypothetical protein
MYLDNIDYVSKICKAFNLSRLEDWEEASKTFELYERSWSQRLGKYRSRVVLSETQDGSQTVL